MKKILLILLLLPVFAKGQTFNLPVVDSTIFTFSSTDSLTHYISPLDTIIIDTAAATLWQIGNTLKPVFSNDTIATHGIMTDTLHHYPANANDFFVLKIMHPINCIIDFWHKYQTDSLHAGGIVEFSTDSTTWINIAHCFGIATQNFYTSSDTLVTGQPAFTGTSRNGEQLSRFQLMNCIGVKTTSTVCFPNITNITSIYIRFRFVSDSTIDSLSGWKIDAIAVDNTVCTGGGINTITPENSITLFPNPAYNELTIQSTGEPINEVTITNLVGQILASPRPSPGEWEVQVDVSTLPAGIYFVKVNSATVRKFVKE